MIKIRFVNHEPDNIPQAHTALATVMPRQPPKMLQNQPNTHFLQNIAH
jgi:hypothetical protein